MPRPAFRTLIAAWLGWGFDAFDVILFNYVAPLCVPDLLHLASGTSEARAATLYWSGTLTALLLIGWAIGGIAFGWLADRFGRARTMMLTILLYALGTTACAFATSLPMLALFRVLASFGIGGEWAAGAALVAEVVPDNRRAAAGAVLYSSAPLGNCLAMLASYVLVGHALPNRPDLAWRAVFLAGAAPALLLVVLRRVLAEPARWRESTRARPSPAEIFSPKLLRNTISGGLMAVITLLTGWSVLAFLPAVATELSRQGGAASPAQATQLAEHAKVWVTLAFNLGGLAGVLLTVPAAERLGRRAMFALFLGATGLLIAATYGLPLSPAARMAMYLPLGVALLGIHGAFTFYLPELYPTRLRGVGAGFCYNIGRFVAAGGTFVVGAISGAAARHGGSPIGLLAYSAALPILGAVLAMGIVETRGRPLAD